ncbi:MAG: PEP-CTERM sorting domain-containing protein [Candidatus Competibacteraceae bacterium]
MKKTNFLIASVLILASGFTVRHAAAFAFRFDDLSESLNVTVDGVPLSDPAYAPYITNIQYGAGNESVSFDVDVYTNHYSTITGYTNLLEASGDVSDRIVLSFVQGALTYHVDFGSDPELPAIPSGAIDLSSLPSQGLPSPYYENGDWQKVATIFNDDGTVFDTYYVRSDIPEPSALALFSVGLLGAMLRRRH